MLSKRPILVMKESPARPSPRSNRPQRRAIQALVISLAVLSAASAAFAQQGPGGNGPGGNGPGGNGPGGNGRVVAPTPSILASNQPPQDIAAQQSTADATGAIATINGIGPTATASNAFFQSLGTNGRTCFTCHQPQSGWTVSPVNIAKRFADTNGQDPIFRPTDGATCSDADVSTRAARLSAYRLLIDKGLIRVGEALPVKGLEFEITRVDDPYQCTSNPKTGLSAPAVGTVSVYRRILPATNLRFNTALMWDGRYPTLEAQATDATLDHAQAIADPSAAQIASIVNFERALTTAQISDSQAGALTELGGLGGPINLAAQPFKPGINDSANRDPAQAPFNRNVFTIFAAWDRAPLVPDAAEARRNAIGRGERLFNTRAFTINNVPGLTDQIAGNQIRGTCSTCHDTPNVGNRSLPDFLDIGVAAANPPALNVDYLPSFLVTCTSGTDKGRQVTTTDPGRALVTGACADISRFKVPTLRGVAARAPYFHNGAADNLGAVIGFYDRRFRIGLNQQDRNDLVAFLEAL